MREICGSSNLKYEMFEKEDPQIYPKIYTDWGEFVCMNCA
jgi:hypothetical protein